MVMISLVVLGLLGFSSCKRNKSLEPDMNGPAGFRIILSGNANPSTLYVPESKPSASTVISVTALNNNGTPVVGKQVVFQENSGYGYFENYKASDVRVTNNAGVAQIVFYLPPGADIKATTFLTIMATLVDDGNVDSTFSQVQDIIKLKVIPYLQQGFSIQGEVMTPSGGGVGGVTINLTGEGGYGGAVTVSRNNGNYRFYVPSGWYGSITPSSEGYSFVPTEIVIPDTNPVNGDLYAQNFVAILEAGDTLAVSPSEIIVGPEGGTQTVRVVNSTSDAAIEYMVVPTVAWIHTSISSGRTPNQFTVTVDASDVTTNRTGSIALTPNGSAAQAAAIEVSQTAQAVDPRSTLIVSISSLSAPSGGSTTTVTVINNATSDEVPYYISVSDQTWITPSQFSGNTNDEFTITIAQNNTGVSRTGTLTVTPSVSGPNLRPWTISISQGIGPTLATSDSTLVFPATGATTQNITITNPTTSDTITFDATKNPADAGWLTVSPTSSTTPATISVIVNGNNTTGSSRTAVLTFADSGSSGAKVTVTVTQSN